MDTPTTILDNLEIVNVEHDLDNGFFWIEFDNGKSLQCCLREKSQTEEEFYINGMVFSPEIDADDCGHNWGICGDVNAWAGEAALPVLLNQAREHGLIVHND